MFKLEIEHQVLLHLVALPCCRCYFAIQIENAQQKILKKKKKKQYFFFLSDCQGAIKATLQPSPKSQLACEAAEKIHRALNVHRLVWIPSHVGEEGNDAADVLANLGAASRSER